VSPGPFSPFCLLLVVVVDGMGMAHGLMMAHGATCRPTSSEGCPAVLQK
jgi:hypothetical protein